MAEQPSGPDVSCRSVGPSTATTARLVAQFRRLYFPKARWPAVSALVISPLELSDRFRMQALWALQELRCELRSSLTSVTHPASRGGARAPLEDIAVRDIFPTAHLDRRSESDYAATLNTRLLARHSRKT